MVLLVHSRCVYLISVGRHQIDVQNVPHISDITENNIDVRPGGHWKPSGCYSRDRIAIVIPFRDRQTHLNILLKYLHPLLQRQQIEYRIFVVEQVLNLKRHCAVVGFIMCGS